MLITVLHVVDPKEPRFTAYRVQLDPDPEAPRYTKVLPNQEITGKIWCINQDDPVLWWSNGIYLITDQGQKHLLTSEEGDPSRSFGRWCNVKDTVTLQGTFLLWTKDKKFRTSSVAWNYLP